MEQTAALSADPTLVTVNKLDSEIFEKWFSKIEIAVIKMLLLLDLVIILGRIVYGHIYHF